MFAYLRYLHASTYDQTFIEIYLKIHVALAVKIIKHFSNGQIQRSVSTVSINLLRRKSIRLILLFRKIIPDKKKKK